jgi:hypothetical protein
VELFKQNTTEIIICFSFIFEEVITIGYFTMKNLESLNNFEEDSLNLFIPSARNDVRRFDDRSIFLVNKPYISITFSNIQNKLEKINDVSIVNALYILFVGINGIGKLLIQP